MNWKLIRTIDTCLGIPLIRLLSLIMPTAKSMELPETKNAPRRILLIKFWGIGNLCMLLPSIQALRQRYPAAAVDFLTLSGNRNALTMTSAVDTVITTDTRNPVSFLRSWRHAVHELRSRHYDLIIDFEQFARFSALLTGQIGAPLTIGYNTRGQQRHHLYTDTVTYNNDIHITRSFFSLVEKAGVTTPFSAANCFTSTETLRQQGQNLLTALAIPPASPLAIMHIGTSDNFRERRWQPQRYAALADLLGQNYGMTIIMTGLPEETHLINTAMQHLKSAAMVRNLGGELTFTDYFALITATDLVISADTAAVHLASAVNTPVVGLYGPNTPRLYGPWGEHGTALYAGFECSPCITNFNGKINTCRHPAGRGACMDALSVESVYDAIKQNYLLANAPHRLKRLLEVSA